MSTEGQQPVALEHLAGTEGNNSPTRSGFPAWVTQRATAFIRVACVVAGLVVGAVVGRLLPPFVLDHGFWRDFLTSAGFGGIMALAAAVIAFGAAAYSSHRSSYNALQDRMQRDLADQREQWWQRFAWATERALEGKTRDVGLVSMIGLVGHPWASEEDTAIAFAVADALEAMDTEGDQATAEGGTDEQT